MNDLEKTIKHFESLQKRYTTEHNGRMCERVADALDALRLYERLTHDFGEVIYEKVLDNFTKIISGEPVDVKPTLQNFVPKNEADREFLENSKDME